MDIDELIIATLHIAEEKESTSDKEHAFYTCQVLCPCASSAFSDIVSMGDLCICASKTSVATLIFFLLEGIFDHRNNKQEWYTDLLHKGIESMNDSTFDGEITENIAYQAWVEQFLRNAKVLRHNISQHIICLQSGNINPSMCDIWTIPRILRQFTDGS